MKRIIFIAITIFFTVNLMAQTDTLVLVNNDVIVGEIKSLDKGVIIFETDYSDSDFKIEWLNVKEVISTQKFIMTFSNGDRINGYIRTNPSDPKKVNVISDDSTLSSFDIKQLVYLKTLENSFLSKLSANIDVGYTFTKARNNHQLSMRSGVSYLTNIWGADGRLDVVRSVQDSTEAIRRTEGNISVKMFLYKDIFATSSANFLQNNEQKLALRSTYDLGIGNYFVHTNKVYLILIVGGAWNDEVYTDPAISSRSDAEAFGSVELNLFDIGDLSLLTNAKLSPSLSTPGRYRADLKFDIKYDFAYDLYIKFGTTYNYDSSPVEGAANSDYVIQTTLGWEWN